MPVIRMFFFFFIFTERVACCDIAFCLASCKIPVVNVEEQRYLITDCWPLGQGKGESTKTMGISSQDYKQAPSPLPKLGMEAMKRTWFARQEGATEKRERTWEKTAREGLERIQDTRNGMALFLLSGREGDSRGKGRKKRASSDSFASPLLVVHHSVRTRIQTGHG